MKFFRMLLHFLELGLELEILQNNCNILQSSFGQKSSAGYYNYSEGSRAPNPAPENEATYEKISSENGFTRRDISDEEIVDRCILALINEGADILSEGVAQRAADIDVVYINGYGFPIWRGGSTSPYRESITINIYNVNICRSLSHSFRKNISSFIY